MRLIKYVPSSSQAIQLQSYGTDSALPAYAILSHRWGTEREEVSFQDLEDGVGLTKPGHGSQKLRFCAEQIRKDGLEYFWVDTCCIDKRSSQELDEAIRSMYRWYASAQVCYVYLDGEWKTSSWWTRGWTLQELLAPQNVQFFVHGESVGSKQERLQEVSDITGIPTTALKGGDRSIAECRQWQNGRQTTVAVDIVYSLLGLLDISMPVMYGETLEQAERRVQDAIDIKQKGSHYKDFSLTFGLGQAPSEVKFVGRRSELREIHDQLTNKRSRNVVALHGLGGIGKTQLAVAYAKQYRDHYSAVFWLNARDVASLKSTFADTARRIISHFPTDMLANANFKDADVVTDAVKAWLSRTYNTHWLLIYDNYDDTEAFDIRHYFPDAYQGSIIITSRSGTISGHCIRIETVDIDSAIQILENSSGRQDAPMLLARRLEGLPLALATAGAYCRDSATSYDEYLALMNKSWTALQRTSRPLPDYPTPLYSTWQISLDRIRLKAQHSAAIGTETRVYTAAANLLQLWGYFDSRDIWFELLRHPEGSPDWFKDLVEDKPSFEAAVRVLRDHGFVQLNDSSELRVQSRGYSTHPCVHDWIIGVLNNKPSKIHASIFITCVTGHMPEGNTLHPGRLSQRLMGHAQRCMLVFEKFPDDWLDARYRLGVFLMHFGDLLQATRWLHEVVGKCERILGDNHLDTTRAMIPLAEGYQELGNFQEAEKIYERCVSRREKAQGKDSVSTAQALNSLANLLARQKRLAEAVPMLERALKACPNDNGRSFLHFAVLGNLAAAKSDMGDHSDVILETLKRAAEGLTRLRGSQDADALRIANTLGNTYVRSGRFREAEATYEENLTMMGKEFGPNHASTVMARHNLAYVLLKQGRSLQAAEMLRLVLTQCAKGSELESIATVNLGTSYQQQSQLEDAELSYLRACKMKSALFGADHPSHAQPLLGLAVVFALRKDFHTAVDYCKRVIATFDELYAVPDLHFPTINNIRLYADQIRLIEQGKGMESFAQAIAAYEACFDAACRYLGVKHHVTRTAYQRLGEVYQRAGQSLSTEITAAMYYGQMASLLVRKGNVGRAEFMCIHAVSAQLKRGDDRAVLDACAELRRLYLDHGLPEELIGHVAMDGPLSGYDLKVVVKQICDATNYAQGSAGNILQASAMRGHIELLQVLIKSGLDINVSGGHYGRALQAATFHNHAEVVKLLLSHGAKANAVGGTYDYAIHCAASNGNVDIIMLLLDAGAEINKSGGVYGHALQTAVHLGWIEAAGLLLDRGADVNLVGSSRGTALQYAAESGRMEMVELLIAHGADVNASSGYFGSALQAAAQAPHLEIVRALLSRGADVNASGGHYGSAIAAAAFKDQLEIVSLLSNADLGADCGEFGSALDCAAQQASLEVVELLLDRGAPLVRNVGHFGNPLTAACNRGKVEVVQVLLAHGAPVNQEGGYWGRALQAAAVRGDARIVKMLLDAGADVNLPGGPQRHALTTAAWHGHLEVVKLLISADINAEGGDQGTALQAASASGYVDIIKLLLKHGADIDIRFGMYGCPLHAAAFNGRVEAARALLDAGADVDARGGCYDYALFDAIASGSLEMLRLLLEYGADVNCEGQQGTPLQSAKRQYRLEMVELLEERGATAGD